MWGKKIIFIVLLFSFFNLNSKTLNICILDTSGLESYKLHPFMDILNSVDFKFDYKSFAQFLDMEQNQLKLEKYDGIFFILGIEFLQGMAKSPASHKILQIIRFVGQNQKKLIGLFLPQICNLKIENKASVFAPIFVRLGINVNNYPFQLIADSDNDLYMVQKNIFEIEKGLAYFSQATKLFFDVPIEAKGFLYNTTLSSPRDTSFVQPNLKFSQISALLPIKRFGCEKLAPTFPYGIYFFDPIRENHFFVSSLSLLSLSGISENFHICPMSFVVRKQIHENIQETFWELNQIVSQKTNTIFTIDFKGIEQNKKPVLPKKVALIGKSIKEKNQEKFLKKIAWMDIGIFEEESTRKPEEKEKIEKQKNIFTEAVIKSGSDLTLWITLNPHMYYSPIARRKDKTEVFWNGVKNLTQHLKDKANELKVKTPKILIGYELTNNIYPPNYPKNPAIDLYENNYFDIPTPLDQNFWDNEIKMPLQSFLREWNKTEINNGLELAGVVLDLEMYCRRTTGAFLAPMGFEPETIKKFVQNPEEQNIHFLLKNKYLQKYFLFLENQAKVLGQDLKKFVNEQLPHGIIACYAPNISVDWFYKGFYAGLSTKEKPIQLLTFNSEFKSHQKWLEKNNIFANHSSVLMLSKIKGQPDFWWINHILEHNHGIWFNKYSRFAEDPSASWTNIEQSPMSREDQLKFFEYLKKN
jgi:hypothetical protein